MTGVVPPAAIALVCAGLELGPLCQELARLIADLPGARQAYVFVMSDEGTRLEAVGACPTRDSVFQLGLGEGAAGRAAGHNSVYHRVLGEDDVLAVPIVHPVVGVIGAIEVEFRVASFGGREAETLVLVDLAAATAGSLALARRLRDACHRVDASQQFADRAVAVQEAERSRMAREIHDGLAQQLAGLGFHLSAAVALLDEDPVQAREQIEAARELAELAGAETRAAIAGLRPPILDDLGLPAALASLTRRAGTLPDAPEIILTVVGDADARLPNHLQTALYRIAQESLRNALRHAAASVIDLVLEFTDRGAELTVRDNGRGFRLAKGLAADRPPEEAFGLRSMRDRVELLGGSFAISSHSGRGTTVRAKVPPTRR